VLLVAAGGCAATVQTPRSPRPEAPPAAAPEPEAAPPPTAATAAAPVEATAAALDDADGGPDALAYDAVQELPDGEEGGDGDEAALDDGLENDDEETAGAAALEPAPHPLDGLSRAALKAMFLRDPPSVGSISLGRIHGGALVNGVRMPEGDAWIVRQPAFSYGTQETVDAVAHCINAVNEQFPGSPRLYVGHLSQKGGGRFPPHVSHQNGRDVDLGYYYSDEEPWYSQASVKNLDRARTWALVKAMVTDTDVELIIIARSIQQLLREHALEIGEDPHWLDEIFGGKTATMRPLIRHARGHGTHLHVRFYSPVARETGRRMYSILTALQKIDPPSSYITHRARKGDTLITLARRYRTSPQAIQRANKLRGNMLREGRFYRIPRKGGVQIVDEGPIVVPPRRLPPATPTGGVTLAGGAASTE
jgi:penicillin-insensitive murein endopeptidase